MCLQLRTAYGISQINGVHVILIDFPIKLENETKKKLYKESGLYDVIGRSAREEDEKNDIYKTPYRAST